VIARVGKPGEFAEDEKDDEAQQEQTQETKRKLFRNTDNKMLGGVFSGLGAYLGWDVTLLRILGVILLFVTHFVVVPIYIIMWFIVPEAKTAADKLQMMGKPMTLENIGKAVSAETESVIANNRGIRDGL
jgi:phage shock protein PspC (stress-responsive transcriptional regulator)